MTNPLQMELWNDSPVPWQKRMEADAFAIAFPEEELKQGDRVEIRPTWLDATESWTCGEGTCYEEGTEARFSITITWHRKWQDPRSGRPGKRIYLGVVDPPPKQKVYERQEAVDFWIQLMRS